MTCGKFSICTLWQMLQRCFDLLQGTTFERCMAVAQNAKLFNTYNMAAGLMPEHAKHAMHTNRVINDFMAAAKGIRDLLDWLTHQDNLNTGSILQLSQIAAALGDMDGYSDVFINVMLIEVRGQLDQCCHLLTFLGSHSAMQLEPVAQMVAELRTTVALQDRATAQQIQQALSRSQELLSSPENESFVRHFAARDSALFDAYLQQSWQHEIDAMLQRGGECLCKVKYCKSHVESLPIPVSVSA